MSDSTGDRERKEVAYLLWQINEGYITDEDRAVGENWMLGDESQMHPDDRAALPGWLEAADHLRGLLAADDTEGKAPRIDTVKYRGKV